MLITNAVIAHLASVLLGPFVARRFFVVSRNREHHSRLHFWTMLALFTVTLTVFAATSLYFIIHGARDMRLPFMVYGIIAAIVGGMVVTRLARRVE